MNKLEFYQRVKHSPMYNYAGIPGLTSWLIHDFGDKGVLRMFESERNHHEVIIPHSHRYDFACEVLAGRVENTFWLPGKYEGSDLFEKTYLLFKNAGEYERTGSEQEWYYQSTRTYKAGDHYEMTCDQIHSIKFSAGAVVLFHEGEDVVGDSLILEPITRGKPIETFEVKDWMFSKT